MAKRIKRGASHSHPLCFVFKNMLTRCNNPKYWQYKNYGGRGIKVCDRWMGENGFIYFADDMGERPHKYQLDRIDVDGDYSPENCRWVDKYTQMANCQNSKGYPGVNFMKSKNKWRARIKHNRKEIHIGMYTTEIEAIDARKKAEKDYV